MCTEKKKSRISRYVLSSKLQVKRLAARSLGLLYRARSYPKFGIPTGLIKAPNAPQQVYPPQPLSHVFPPQTMDDEIHWRYKAELVKREEPECGILTLEAAYATNRGCNLSAKCKLYTTYLQPIDGKQPKNYEIFELTKNHFTPKILQTEKTILSLATWWQGGFYHWFFDVLARLHLVEKAKISFDALFIAAGTSFQKESLCLLGIQEDQILNAHDFDAIFAPKIYIPSIISGPTSWGCRFLRERMTRTLSRKSKKRIYVTRNDATRRRVTNEDEVIQLVRRYGFACVALSHRSLQEQIELFYNAEMVVGPHGAGFSHMLFADPGTPLLEFFSPDYVNICYWSLCNRIGHPYYYLFGEGERHPDGFDPHRDPDMVIDLQKLDATLRSMNAHTHR